MLSYREETRGPLQRLPTLTGAQGRHQHLGSGPGRFRFGVCQSRCRIGAYQPSNSTDILHQALRTSRRLALCNICRMLGICVCSQSSTSPCSNNLCLKGSSLQITFYYEPPPPPKNKNPQSVSKGREPEAPEHCRDRGFCARKAMVRWLGHRQYRPSRTASTEKWIEMLDGRLEQCGLSYLIPSGVTGSETFDNMPQPHDAEKLRAVYCQIVVKNSTSLVRPCSIQG